MHPIQSQHAGEHTDSDEFLVAFTAEVRATPSIYLNDFHHSY